MLKESKEKAYGFHKHHRFRRESDKEQGYPEQVVVYSV
jgi:hypothetical protein